MKIFLTLLVLLIAPASLADDVARIRVYNYEGNRGAVHHTGPVFSSHSTPSLCFPYGCGGMGPTLRNPDPDARKPSNLTSCIYNASGVLVYEREDKSCSDQYVDKNQIRINQRR